MTQSSYLSIDPGDTIGWATFDDKGELLEIGQVDEKFFVKWISDAVHPDLKHVICEDYVLYQHKAMGQTNKYGRQLKTAKMVGKIDMICEMRGVPFTKQEAQHYRIGAMWGGIEIPSNHSISHQYVAAAHGIYWLQKNEIRKPRVTDETL